MGVNSGRLVAAIGSSRSGKSKFVTRETATADRLLVWDVKGEYGGVDRITGKSSLIREIKARAGKPGRLAFVPESLGDFDFFCRAAAAWVKSHYLAGKNCSLVFEETADVTSPGKAPEAYGIILRRFLSYGVTIYAVTQRPAESDKTAVGNASIVHVCRLQLDRDRKAVARDTGLSLEEIAALVADQENGRFDYLHADTGTGKYHKGQLTFPKGKANFSKKTSEKPL